MEWPASFTLDSRGRWRRRVINEALRPAERTADWLSVIESLRREGDKDGVDAIAEGLSGLSVISARAQSWGNAAMFPRKTIPHRGGRRPGSACL